MLAFETEMLNTFPKEKLNRQTWLAFETEMLTYPMENLTFEHCNMQHDTSCRSRTQAPTTTMMTMVMMMIVMMMMMMMMMVMVMMMIVMMIRRFGYLSKFGLKAHGSRLISDCITPGIFVITDIS